MDILNAHTYIEQCLWIKNKSGQVQRLKLNPPQEKLYEAVRNLDRAGKPIRIIEALIFHGAVTHRNREALIVAHREDATSNLFRMSKRYFDLLDEPMKPMLKASNARELVFENPSRTRRSGKSGRGCAAGSDASRQEARASAEATRCSTCTSPNTPSGRTEREARRKLCWASCRPCRRRRARWS